MNVKNIFGFRTKIVEQKENTAAPPSKGWTPTYGDTGDGLFKAFAPDYLYNPPYGRPRKDDVILMRNLCKNAFISGVVWTLSEEVAHTEFDIVVKKQFIKNGRPVVDRESERGRILEWFYNPNGNEESFNQILKKVTTDILEIESGVMVKVFNTKGEFKELFALDGATILKNPDQYGYYGHRDDLVPWFTFLWDPKAGQYVKVPTFKGVDDLDRYAMKDRAAFFQYGNYIGFPVPFGKREIVHISRNARTDVTYARPPVAILGDVLYTLIYGSAYNNAFYVNNNIPDGILSVVGASGSEIDSLREQFYANYRVKDGFGNTVKKFFKIPFMNSEVKFTPIMLDPQVMQVLEQQQWFIRLVWSCFGVTPDEMGVTDSSGSKNVSGQQSIIHKRKSVEPLLRILEYHINTQIMPEFGVDELEFKFREFDVDEELKKYQLYQLQLSTNMATINELRAKEGLPPVDGGDKTQQQTIQEQIRQYNNFGHNNNQHDDVGGHDSKEKTTGDESNDGDAEVKSVIDNEKELLTPINKQLRAAEEQILEIVRTLDDDQLKKL